MPLKMAHKILFTLLQATIILISRVQVAVAVVHIVGGPAGWDFAPTASYYTDWASENIFVPGDKLSFRYDPNDHNVQQVDVSDFATCNNSKPIKQYQTGHDVITLAMPGMYYFICGFSAHCDGGGMLIKLLVRGSTSPPPPSHPLPPIQHFKPPPHPHHSPPPPPITPSTIPPTASQVSPPSPSSRAPPPILESPLPPPPHAHPHGHPKPHQNRTYESPSAPAVPPPISLPTSPAPTPGLSNYSLAPAPSDDYDNANLSRYFSMEFVFAGLVVAGAFLLW